MRVHLFFPLAALVFFNLGAAGGWQSGLALFLLLVAAVAVREIARLLISAYLGLRLRAVMLLPIGGLYAYATPESQEKSAKGATQYLIAAAGPVANLLAAGALTMIFLGASPSLNLMAFPLVDAAALVRSMVWMQVAMAALHLLPAYPLDCGRLLRNLFSRSRDMATAARAAAGLGQFLALAAMLSGMLLRNPWLMLVGFFILIGAQVEDQGIFFQSVVDTVHMREVMLTDFATLSPSDTLVDALARSVHALQDEFPVVRGTELVGIVSRQRIVDALRSDGNTYIQSVMNRVFQTAAPDDTLGAAIRRLSAGRGLALIPVIESGRVLGLVSVQNLMNSMALLAEQRRVERQNSGE